ncbi:MAG: DNA polymerase III subunit delta [Kiritimatiellae bacterium]|nr:DNA polymerase III subunit delta [Kiritimatiellia bacterium]
MNASAHTGSAGVYLFSGEDDYLLVQDARVLANKLIPPAEQTLGLEIIEARARNASEAGASIARCLEALRTPGFTGARKAVWLKQANFLDRSLLARSREVTETLASLTGLIKSGLPPGNMLIVTSNAVDKAAAFFKACQAKGEIHLQAALKPWEKEKAAIAFVRSALRNNKLQFSGRITEAIVALAGTETRQLIQEVNKLALFVHPRREVREEDIRGVVASARESSALNLADAVGRRDLPKAIALMRQLLFQKENEIGLVMGLESRFRYLLIMKEMASGKTTGREKGVLEALLAGDKGRPPHEYFLKKLDEQARLFSRQELDAARSAILATRLKLVSSSGLEELLLEKLIIQLCRRRVAARGTSPAKSDA